jgi:hypothetical protein
MRFEVPAGSALVFSEPDGELLSEPRTQPLMRIVQAGAPDR